MTIQNVTLSRANDQTLHLDAHYIEFLSNIKERLKTKRIHAALAVNRELINFYWQLGNDIIAQQKKYAWGEHFLHQFSDDLRKEFPGMQGLSVSNLKRMRLFANEYPIGSQAVNQLPYGIVINQADKIEWLTDRIIQIPAGYL